MSQIALLRTRRFLPLFLTQFAGAFNDNVLKNALVILVAFQARTVLGMPPSEIVIMAGGIFILPFFLFSATAGQLADAYDKARIVRWVKISEIAIMFLALFGFVAEQFELLLLTLFLMGVHSTFFGPVKYSILPQHLTGDELVGGNALVEAGTFVAILLGTIAGGVLVSLPEIGTKVVSGVLVATAVAGWLVSRLVPIAPPSGNTPRVEWNPWRPTRDIIRSARENKNVFMAIMAISWFWLVGAAFLSLFPGYAKDVLHCGQGTVTLFLACFSIGIALGSLLCEFFSRERLELGLVPLGSLGLSAFALDLWWVGVPEVSTAAMGGALLSVGEFLSNGTSIRIVVDLLLMSVFCGFFIVPLYTFIQWRTEPALRSRVIAANNILNSIFMVAAAGILILFVKLGLQIPQIFCVIAIMNLVVASYVYFYMPEYMLRFLVWILGNIMYRLRVVGHDHIPKDGPVVLIANHVSFVDWLLISAAVKRPASFVMDHSFYKGGIASWLLKQTRAIPIASAKENPELLERAFESIAAELKEDNVVCIFPEGKITRNGELNPFRPGIERIIGTSPVPVVPMAICNMWGSFFSRKDGPAMGKKPSRFWSRVEIRIGGLVPAAEVSSEKLQGCVAELLKS